MQSDLDAVVRSGHTDIREENVEAIRSVEQLDGFIPVERLDHLEALVLQGFRGHHTYEALVLDEQDLYRCQCKFRPAKNSRWPSGNKQLTRCVLKCCGLDPGSPHQRHEGARLRHAQGWSTKFRPRFSLAAHGRRDSTSSPTRQRSINLAGP